MQINLNRENWLYSQMLPPTSFFSWCQLLVGCYFLIHFVHQRAFILIVVTGGTSVNRSLAQAEVTSVLQAVCAAVKGIEGLPGAISNLCSTIVELKTAVESIAVQEETVEDKEEHPLFVCEEDDDSGDEGGNFQHLISTDINCHIPFFSFKQQ
jgi:hypothetical protein